MREYFRGNLWPNTPDIIPHHLDHGRPAFIIRAVLAATLSPSWGIYSGFELCEQGASTTARSTPAARSTRSARGTGTRRETSRR